MAISETDGRLIHDLTAPLPAPAVEQWSNDLDRSAFLNLLVTQLRFQDPLNPMDDREFIAQLAQFSALEQMQNLNATFSRSHAFSMMGQNVVGASRNSSTGQLQTVGGMVDSVRMIAGEPWLIINSGTPQEMMLNANDVQLVESNWTLEQILQSLMFSNESNMVNQNMALVGRYVQAVQTNAQGTIVGFVEGRVEYVDFSGQIPMLVIGNDMVHLGQILSVADDPMLIGRDIAVYVEDERVIGQITQLRFIDNNPYIVVNGASHRIDAINFVTEALRLQRSGTTITHGATVGTIDDVFVQDGAVWVRIYDGYGLGDAIRFSTLR